MLRLRTSTSLSVLLLATGVLGTAWLSTLSGQSARVAVARVVAKPLSVSSRHRSADAQRRPDSIPKDDDQRLHAPLLAVRAEAAEPTNSSPIELIPLATPGDTSGPWYQLQGHLEGLVVLHLGIDGSGRVQSAEVRQSSGDRILDERALRSVRGWRFFVPADHPEGFNGDLPMRFASGTPSVATAG